MKKIRILSLDGGGIRGILPGTILTYIEEQIRIRTGNNSAKIGEYFDFIAGTSTGAFYHWYIFVRMKKELSNLGPKMHWIFIWNKAMKFST